MDTTKLIIAGLVILFVLGLNIGLIRAARRGSFHRDIEMYRRVSQGAQAPWQKENQDLEELSRLVSQLKEIQNDKQENETD
jgi:hypothetical protein